jgi:hypothetical protein
VLVIGLALAGAAVAVWLHARGLEAGDAAGPHAEIDAASRAALEKILEEADRNEDRDSPRPSR